ncbi:MAG: hypothetical protein U5R49_12895 [Deltaproteobacteria bacterium]|nr:hypothetical protein [Deltaproteobacteria bacterium]
MHILFNKKGYPIKPKKIRKAVSEFGYGYNETVRKVIVNSSNGVNRHIFRKNVAILRPNFKMTRQGPFKGIQYVDGKVIDPNKQITACWREIGEKTIELSHFLKENDGESRTRILLEMVPSDREEVASALWEMFKKLVSLCMEKNTLGLVAASKVLFAAFPEVAQAIDNAEWRTVFKTIDYRDIILDMASEIAEWERRSETRLESCDPHAITTLPSVYNVMAMKAREMVLS